MGPQLSAVLGSADPGRVSVDFPELEQRAVHAFALVAQQRVEFAFYAVHAVALIAVVSVQLAAFFPVELTVLFAVVAVLVALCLAACVVFSELVVSGREPDRGDGFTQRCGRLADREQRLCGGGCSTGQRPGRRYAGRERQPARP